MKELKELKIKIKSYDVRVVDETAKKVYEVAKIEGEKISGPIPLPIRKEIFTVLKSVHVNKKAREQFEIRTHKRLIVITNPSSKIIETLKRMELSAGVDVEVIN